MTKSASLIASRRSVVAHTVAGRPLSRIMRRTKASILRSFASVGDMSANSLARRAGVARMSAMSVLQKTTEPAPIIAIFAWRIVRLQTSSTSSPARSAFAAAMIFV
jgi:hypothetical protein